MVNIDITKIIQAAENGGREVNKYFGDVLKINEKSTLSDFRTKADTESEKAILSVLKSEFPDFNILSEETGVIDKNSEYTFIIDPLDGTNNFVLGIPNFSISIALMKNDELILGVVHIPILGQTYYAQKGKGAYLNDRKLSVNSEQDMKRVTISYTCGYINSRDFSQKLQKKLDDFPIKRVLTMWSPAVDLCLLASGKIEAIINNANEIYDFAAGKIIAREAGAVITDFEGNKDVEDRSNVFIVSNTKNIQQNLIVILKNF